MTNLFIPPSFKEGFFGVDNVSIPIPICSTPIVITNIAMHLEKQLRIHLNGALCFTCTQLRPKSQCSSHRSLNDILDIFRIMSPDRWWLRNNNNNNRFYCNERQNKSPIFISSATNVVEWCNLTAAIRLRGEQHVQ